ncbi:acylphosphate phosphohydrolase [Streptococcus pneumoniae]|nr:acylphosphate phosphohydrolase [Streptococcus pneumoniae]
MQKVRMIAQGRVQGVGFRWGVYSLALEIGGITGRVWNNDDGTVEILAQADSSAIMAKFIQEIRKGPTDTFFKSKLLRCQTKQLSSLL